MEDTEKKSILESILFLSGEPVALSSLKGIADMDEPEVVRLLNDLMNEYNARNGGVLIREIAHGYQMVTNPVHTQWIKKLRGVSSSGKLSVAALETLAIVAYKQPMTKAEIEQVRGVNADGVVKTLLDRRLIKIMGRKEAAGKPLLYGTTREFLQYFGLKDLSELPTLKEFDREEVM